MMKKAIAIGWVSMLLFACQTQKQPHVSYTVSRLDSENAAQLKVQMRFTPNMTGETILEYPDAAWGEEALHNVLQNMQVANAEGTITQNKDSGWIIIKHDKDIEKLEFEYVLQQDFTGELSTEKVYRPIIQPEYFHVFSHNLFMLPKNEKEELDIALQWDGFPEEYVIHNSFGSKERIRRLTNISKAHFGSAIFVGGDFKVYQDTIRENVISLATRGVWIPFKEQEVFEVLKTTLSAQRNFWEDHSQEYFTVTLQPFPQVAGSSFQGTGLTNSFATSVSNNEFTEIAQLVYLFNHELMHNWIGHTIENDNEEEQYWFSEGFTEYYTFKNIAQNRIHGLDAAFYIDEINRTIRNLSASPVKDAPNTEINYDNFWSNREYGKLPYYRGALFAFYLDQRIRKSTEGAKSLDDVMRSILKAAREKGQKLTHDYFLSVTEAYFPNGLSKVFEKHIVEGVPLPLSELFEELGVAYEEEAAIYELGLEFSEDRKTITAVVPGSKAEAAGVRKNDRLASRSIYHGNVTKPVELGVVRNGKTQKISFFPVKTVKVPQLKNTAHNRKVFMP